MTKLTITFLGLFSMVTSLVMAQNETNIYWGKENVMQKKGTIHFLGKRGNVLLAYQQYGKNVSILKYSYNDLQVSGQFPLIGKLNGEEGISKDYTFDQIVMLKNKNYVCVTQYEKSGKQNVLYMQEFDNSGRLKGNMKKIVEMTAINKSNRGAFDLIISKDSSKFLLVNVPPYEKYSGEKFGFQVVDQNLNIIDNAQISLPNNFKYFLVPESEITLSNDGMVYMMAQITQQKSDKTKGESSYYFELLAINPHGKGEVTTYDLKLPEKSITDISYSLEEGKYIICSGFYGNIKNNATSTGQIDGVFYFRINKETKEIESVGSKALDRDFVADLTTEKNADKGKGISNNFTLVNFTKRTDGGAILVSEYRETYVTETTSSTGHGGFTTTYHTHYIRNKIIVININPDGTIKWYASIPKFQATVDDGGTYSSFFMATKGDKMYFVYNDNPNNLDPTKVSSDKKLRTMSSPAKATAVLVEMSESGQFTKSALFNSKENKATIMPDEAVKIGPSEFIVPAIHLSTACCSCGVSFGSSKYKLARFEFK